jgi:C4-type Zn-finger protein
MVIHGSDDFYVIKKDSVKKDKELRREIERVIEETSDDINVVIMDNKTNKYLNSQKLYCDIMNLIAKKEQQKFMRERAKKNGKRN